MTIEGFANIIKGETVQTFIKKNVGNLSSYSVTPGEKWLYTELGLPLDQHVPINIRNSVGKRISDLYRNRLEQEIQPQEREVIRQSIKKIAIEERFFQLTGNTADQACRIAFVKNQLPLIHENIEIYEELNTKAQDIFRPKIEELQKLLEEEAKAHPCHKRSFQASVKGTLEATVIDRLNSFLPFTRCEEKGLIKKCYTIEFESRFRPAIQELCDITTLDIALFFSKYNWYIKWKNKLIVALSQGENQGEKALGIGVCGGMTLRLICEELTNPDMSLEQFTSLVEIQQKDRFIQARAKMFSRMVSRKMTQSFFRSIGLKQSSYEEETAHNIMYVTPEDPKVCDYPSLIKGCWDKNRLMSGVYALFLEPNKHALYVRYDINRNIYRFFDSNIGVMQLDSPNEFYEALGDWVKTYSDDFSSLIFTRYELSTE